MESLAPLEEILLEVDRRAVLIYEFNRVDKTKGYTRYF